MSATTQPAPIIRHIFICPAHVYRGHHGMEPGEDAMVEVPEVRCLAGQGLEGDRYVAKPEGHKGQITFFDWAVYRDVCAKQGDASKPPSVFRRNVIVEGLDLNAQIGKEFEIQGIRFFGTEECSPCYWMDRAFGPGTEAMLKGRGGLRARILTNGTLRRSG